ncbi:MAG: PQQ-dependent sugar dehydrogenase [Hyphomonadaceae bacterium]|nr:PQQ-dependent sugar dehydrogenase [Hyphomonadaceae bacterium]
MITKLTASLLRRPRWLLAAALAVTAAAGGAAGIWVDRSDLLGSTWRRIETLLRGDRQRAYVRVISTHFQQLRVSQVNIGRAMISGGSIAPLGDDLLIISPHGQLSYLDVAQTLHTLDVPTPMNMEALRQHELYQSPTFLTRSMRSIDLHVAPTADPNAYDIYLTHDRFSETCLDFVLSRMRLRREGGGALVPEGGWNEVWRAAPCLRFDDVGAMVGYPPQTGGRIVQLNPRELLISIGDYAHVGASDRNSEALNPNSDFGKMVVFDLDTGATRHFASGFRNPQGLVIARDGRIWSTDHGPQGGDEVNLVMEGQSYGWPLVTYGMDYTTPPQRWPLSPAVSTHEGHTRPRLAFVPSVGISAIAQADPVQFPNWAGSLLVASMRAQTLFVVRTEGDEIIFSEPIPLNFRLRDIATLADGRLAILADGSTLLVIENADMPQRNVEVAAFQSLPPAGPEEGARTEGSRVDWGRSAFEASCAACHSVSGARGVGPPLNGVVGRAVASLEGYPYSAGLRQRQGAWTESAIAEFILRPEAFAPGSDMPSTPLSPPGAQRVAAYLATTRGGGESQHTAGSATPNTPSR